MEVQKHNPEQISLVSKEIVYALNEVQLLFEKQQKRSTEEAFVLTLASNHQAGLHLSFYKSSFGLGLAFVDCFYIFSLYC